MSYDIEDGIPVPKFTKKLKYPFLEMKIGQSVLITDKKLLQIRSYASNVGKKIGYKFKVAQTDEGVRVWRVAETKVK